MRSVDGFPHRYFSIPALLGGAIFSLALPIWAYDGEGIANSQAILQQLQMQQTLAGQPHLHFKSYNAKLFKTAYQAYIFNGEPAKAFQIALAAVLFRPDDLEWRERLAQSASWSSHAEVALDQYLYFFQHNHQKSVNLERIFTLALQLQNYDLQLFALEEKRKLYPEVVKKIDLDIVKTMQGQGRPLAAIAFIKQHDNYQNDKDWQEALRQLAFGTANRDLLLQTLQRLQELEPQNNQYPVQIAGLLWNKNKPQEAFAWLRRYFLQHRHNHLGKTFLDYYIYAASSMNRPAVLLEALRYLVAEHGTSRSDYLDLVYLETALGFEQQAFSHALAGYKANRDKALLANLLGLGLAVHQERTVLALVAALTPEEKRRFFKGYGKYINLANLYTAVGQYALAAPIWQTLVTRYPDKRVVQVGYLWFLMDSDAYPALKQALFALSKPNLLQEIGSDALWRPISVSYITLAQYAKAQAVLQMHGEELLTDVSGLIDWAETWQELEQPIRAYWLRQMAFAEFVRQHPVLIARRLDAVALTAFAQLMRFFGGAEASWLALQEVYRRATYDSLSPEQIIAFALEKNNNSLAGLLIRSMRLAHKRIPSWLELTLAMNEWDKDAMANMLQKPRLQERDKTNAALKIEHFAHAEQYAYEGLQLKPFDNENYQLFKQVTLPRANRLRTDNYYFAFNSLVGYYNKIDATFRVSPGFMITPYNHIWFIHNQDATIIQAPPSTMRNTGAVLHQWIHRGWLEYRLEERQGLEQFMSGALNWRYLLSERLAVQSKIAVNEEANETATLLLGGMKNTLETLWAYNYSDFELFDVFLGAWQYRGQNRQRLGNGLGVSGHWQHHFTLNDPDWNANVYLETRYFQDNKVILQDPLQRLLPPNAPPNSGSNFYMPVGYNQAALVMGYGQKYRDEYCQQWRSFLDIGATYSDAFGIGKIFSMGYGGKLFGRDKLLFYIDYSDNTQQGTQQVYSAGLRYDYYF